MNTAGNPRGRVGETVREILSFVNSTFDPEACAGQWMVRTGKKSMSTFRHIVTDLEDIQQKTWLLACALSVFSEGTEAMLYCPFGDMS